MHLALDLIILAVIFITTFIGYKRGLINVAFGFLSFIIALVISLLLYKPISNVIVNYTPLANTIESHIEERIATSSQSDANSFMANYYHNAKNASTSLVARGMATSIISIICGLIVFIIARIILLFIKISSDLIAKLPLIKQCNHVGGFIYGVLLGFVLIYGIFTIIAVLAPLIDLSTVTKSINSSIIGNIMYNNNIIFMFFV